MPYSGSFLTFGQQFHVKIMDKEHVALLSEDAQFLLTGRLYVELAKQLAAYHLTEEQAKRELSLNFPFSDIEHAIGRLKKKGYLTTSSGILPQGQEAFWHDMGLRFDQIDRLSSLDISIKKYGLTDPAELALSLTKLGVRIAKKEGSFDICIVDNYINPELEKLNQKNLKDKKPWTLVKPTGIVLWLGPIFIPEKTGCWNCLLKCLYESRRAEVDILGIDKESLNICSRVILPTNQALMQNIAANEVAKWAAKGESVLENNILTLDTRDLSMQLHPFNRDPDCDLCSQCGSLERPAQIKLESSSKGYISSEDERACSPEETLSRIKPVSSTITGIVSKIKHTKVNNTHICLTMMNMPAPALSMDCRKIRIPSIVVGKGTTQIQAEAGCLAEAIERYNCTYYKQFQLRSSYDEIKSQSIHPSELLHFSEAQYVKREILNAERGPFNYIPKRFDEKKTIGWTPFISLIDGQTRYVPSSYCYITYPYPEETTMCPADSNGCASGNTKEEAINYAILELIERDAFAVWWYNRIPRPAIDLEALDDDSLNRIRCLFSELKREFYVLDVTCDLDVPTFAAISWQKRWQTDFSRIGVAFKSTQGIIQGYQ